ncbi:hypothetical protein D3C87_2025260 [compost metagenome]
MVKFSTWPALAPTWKVRPLVATELPSSSFLVLNSVLLAMRLISDESWSSSSLMFARSLAVRVSLAPWTASSRIRCRIA